MRILTVTSQKHIGGVTTVVYEVAASLGKLGNQVYILEGARGSKEREKKGKIKVINYPLSGDYWRSSLSTPFVLWSTLSRLSKSKQFDLFYGHLSLASLVTFLHPLSRHRPKVYHFHGAHGLEVEAGILPPKRHKILGRIKRFLQFTPKIYFEELILRLCLGKADLVIAPSQWAKRLLMRRYKIGHHKIKVLGHPVDIKIFRPVTKGKRLALRKKFGFDSEALILTTVSRLEPRKAIETVLKIAPDIHKKFPKTFFLLVFPLNNKHEENYFIRLYRLATVLNTLGYTRFLSGFEKGKLIEIYQLSDVVLMPSKTLENLPNVCLEALACGVPVVGTPIGGIPEILRPIDKNLLAKSPSEKDFYQALTDYLKLNPQEKKKISKEAREFLRTHFEGGKIAKNFLSEFKNVK